MIKISYSESYKRAMAVKALIEEECKRHSDIAVTIHFTHVRPESDDRYSEGFFMEEYSGGSRAALFLCGFNGPPKYYLGFTNNFSPRTVEPVNGKLEYGRDDTQVVRDIVEWLTWIKKQ